jgi:hypothetical protein
MTSSDLLWRTPSSAKFSKNIAATTVAPAFGNVSNEGLHHAMEREDHRRCERRTHYDGSLELRHAFMRHERVTYVKMRALDSIPEFAGIDGSSYKLEKNEAVHLPETNAKVLWQRKLAVLDVDGTLVSSSNR